MKTKLVGFLILVSAATVTNVASGVITTNAALPADVPIQTAGQLGNSLLLLGVSVVTPMIIRLGKFLVPKIPSWVLPIAAPALVALADWISGLMGGPSVNPVLALLIGSAGVGLREIKDQVTKRIASGPVAAPS